MRLQSFQQRKIDEWTVEISELALFLTIQPRELLVCASVFLLLAFLSSDLCLFIITFQLTQILNLILTVKCGEEVLLFFLFQNFSHPFLFPIALLIVFCGVGALAMEQNNAKKRRTSSENNLRPYWSSSRSAAPPRKLFKIAFQFSFIFVSSSWTTF